MIIIIIRSDTHLESYPGKSRRNAWKFSSKAYSRKLPCISLRFSRITLQMYIGAEYVQFIKRNEAYILISNTFFPMRIEENTEKLLRHMQCLSWVVSTCCASNVIKYGVIYECICSDICCPEDLPALNLCMSNTIKKKRGLQVWCNLVELIWNNLSPWI
jgi:hypothetical protein